MPEAHLGERHRFCRQRQAEKLCRRGAVERGAGGLASGFTPTRRALRVASLPARLGECLLRAPRFAIPQSSEVIREAREWASVFRERRHTASNHLIFTLQAANNGGQTAADRAGASA